MKRVAFLLLLLLQLRPVAGAALCAHAAMGQTDGCEMDHAAPRPAAPVAWIAAAADAHQIASCWRLFACTAAGVSLGAARIIPAITPAAGATPAVRLSALAPAEPQAPPSPPPIG